MIKRTCGNCTYVLCKKLGQKRDPDEKGCLSWTPKILTWEEFLESSRLKKEAMNERLRLVREYEKAKEKGEIKEPRVLTGRLDKDGNDIEKCETCKVWTIHHCIDGDVVCSKCGRNWHQTNETTVEKKDEKL